MNKLRIGATGLSGLVGSRVRELTTREFAWENFSHGNGFDITDRDMVSRVLTRSGAKAFIHFAAFTDMDEAEKQKGNVRGSCYLINVIGTKNIADACRQSEKHLIYISTDAVFDGGKRTPYTEKDKPHPISWYGETKWLGEQEILNSGCPWTIIRIAYPFRARFKRKSDFVRKVIKKLHDKQKVVVFHDTLFTPTFVDDIAFALVVMIKKNPRGIYHVVGSTSISPFQAASEVTRVFGLDSSLIFSLSLKDYVNRGGRSYPQFAALSNHKLKQQLGISMKTFSQALLTIKKQRHGDQSTL